MYSPVFLRSVHRHHPSSLSKYYKSFISACLQYDSLPVLYFMQVPVHLFVGTDYTQWVRFEKCADCSKLSVDRIINIMIRTCPPDGPRMRV
jgi:hypothetical protein